MPVVDVAVDVPQAHLDRPFSYAVPPELRAQVAPGVKVGVTFAGRSVGGWVLAVRDSDRDEADRLRPLRRVVSPVPGLAPQIARVARRVADHYAGTAADVLRTAVPPRHARAEAKLSPPTPQDRTGPQGEVTGPEPFGWGDVVGGSAFLARVRAGQRPWAAVRLPLDTDPWLTLAAATEAAVASGRRALIVVPNGRDVAACAAALAAEEAPGAGLAAASGPRRQPAVDPARVLTLTAESGPAARWRAHLRAAAGQVDVVVGTRAAVFAPLPDLGLVALWDDGDDSLAEPRAPGWHARTVAVERAREDEAALALVSRGRSAETQQLVLDGLLKELRPDRERRRRGAPRIVVLDPEDPLEAAARLPRTAHRVVGEAVPRGPVLISVPRAGYLPVVGCQRCRRPARCRHCGGPLGRAEPAELHCARCGRSDAEWRCPACGDRRVRARAVGVRRSFEEIGRAFPGVRVLVSDADHRVADVSEHSALVLATPGAEPVAAGGYTAAVVLDGEATLARAGLAVPEETARRWLELAALVRPRGAGGVLVLVAEPGHPVVQAVVRDAPEELAERLCRERAEAGLPPAKALARFTGRRDVLSEIAAELRGDGLLPLATLAESGGSAGSVVSRSVAIPRGGEGAAAQRDRAAQQRDAGRLLVLGPVPDESHEARLLLTGPRAVVVAGVRQVLAAWDARHRPDRPTVRIDPIDLV